jgi:amino acid adenylation domain-containing protein
MICSISDYLSEAARFAGGACAIRDNGVGHTFAQLDAMATNVADAVIRAGARPGDRVGIMMGKSALQAACILGAARAQCVFVVIDERLKSRQVSHVVADSGMCLMLTDAGEAGRELPPGLAVLSLSLASLAEKPAGRPAFARPAIRGDLACLMYTSGSTGPAKGVMVSHGNLIAGAESVTSYLGLAQSDRIGGILPFCFDYGLNQLLCALRVRCRLVMCRMVFHHDIVVSVRQEAVTVLAGVPATWAGLAQLKSGAGDESRKSVRIVTNSGGAVGPKMLESIRLMFPSASIYLMYGLTEAFRSTYLPPDQLSVRPGSIGKAIPGAEVFLLTPDGRRAGPGETGEIVHRGDTVAMGYWNLPDATSRVFKPHPFPQPGGCRTEYAVYSGDYARMDDEGYLYFLGRRDSQLKVGGTRVSPEEIEAVLAEAPGVAECVVVGLERELGHEIVACVVGGPPLSQEALQRHCNGRLPRYMVPRRFELCTHLPKLPSGKWDRAALCETLSRQPGPASEAEGDANAC